VADAHLTRQSCLISSFFSSSFYIAHSHPAYLSTKQFRLFLLRFEKFPILPCPCVLFPAPLPALAPFFTIDLLVLNGRFFFLELLCHLCVDSSVHLNHTDGRRPCSECLAMVFF
jgi:hypothetical protein